MAEYTENLELIKPSESELMGASREFYNGDMDILDEAISAIREALGGISVIRTDQAAYDSEEHSSNDLYLCADTGHIYLGDTQMGGGGDATPHVICTQSEYDAMASHDAGTIYIIVG